MSSRIGSTIATFILSVPVSGVGLVYGLPYLNKVLESPQSDGVVRSPDALNMFREMVRGQNDGTDAPEFTDLGSGEVSPWEEFPSERGQAISESQLERDAGSFWNTEHSDHQHPASNSLDSPANWTHNHAPDRSPSSESFTQNGSTAHPSPNGYGTAPPAASPESGMSSTNWSANPPAVRPATMSTPMVNPNATPASPAVTSLREAAQHLQELGINQYHLERGSTNESFLFVCLFSPGDAPHVTHRFEAEATDPLIAVNQVLAQVNGWLNQRYAQHPMSLSSGNL